jgi:uncharacterized protein YcbK (DUF882 family)
MNIFSKLLKILNVASNVVEEISMEEQITKNFSLSELTYSNTAKSKGISNIPSESDYANMKALCENILQPLRDKLGKPILINSCYRGKLLNEAVGGAKSSQHMTGSAADIHVAGMTMYELATYIKNNFNFDQLILEYSDAPSYINGWVHVSYNNGGSQRNQCLTINKSGTKLGF